MKKNLNFIFALLPLIAFLLLWEYVFAATQENTFKYSKPSLIYKALYENICLPSSDKYITPTFSKYLLINDFIVTGLETLTGFILGNLVGIILGFSLWYFPRMAYISKPYIIAIGAIPVFSLAPMTIMWFGTDFFAKALMAAISTFTVALVQSYNGAQNVDINQINLLKTFGASRFAIFKKVIVPSSLIWVISSIRMNVGFALLGSFIGEFISASEGLGFRIVKATGLYDTSVVFASLLCLIIFAFFLNAIVSIFEKRAIEWKN